ncbi:PKD domain-containing protein [Agrilutibacter solisilvae]|uniref:PKD domain-containing protein n=1 Tax=Agrilutibacter solisilvae TaxID=2763317 RepID=A0A975ATA4_9GAMM|nr:PKD domain-containing protein [Lysobacter solisilvae]
MRIGTKRLSMPGALTCASVLCAGLLSLAPALAGQRIAQLPEDGTQTRRITARPGPLADAPVTRVCESGAKWIRLNFSQLTLRSYDTLVLTSSGGDRFVFDGRHWNDRSFSARAMRGSCVDLQASFGSADSRYRVESFQFGTRALDATPVVVAGAGDICDSSPADCGKTSDLIVAINPTAVFTAGDNAYSSGTLTEYNTLYAPRWGRFKALTSPSPGNHDYLTSNAAGYFDYFNGAGNQTGPAGDRSKGYYSYDVGDWHFVALNTMSGGTVASTQLTWLQDDLAATTKPCIAAYFHHPLVSRGNYTGYSQVKPIMDRLYAARADLVLVGHDHNYQRYGKMDGSQAAKADGMRQILIGTGGRDFYSLSGTHALLEASQDHTWGVLKLSLTATGYTGDFVPVAGKTWTDTFSGTCNAKAGSNTPPVANFSFSTNGLSASFTDGSTDANGTIASRAWSFGDGGTSTATNPSHTYAAAGTYNVGLTVTDNQGATHSVTRPVTVTATGNTPPVADFSFVATQLTVAFTDASTDSDGSIASRAWSFGDGGTSTATSPGHTYAAAGTYTVALAVTDNAGATHTASRTVAVTAPPGNVLANGVPVTGLSAAKDASLNYTMTVPAGATALKFETSGGTGDADLYVKAGSAPTDASYDCRPYKSGNAETCTFATVQPGTYYVRLKAYSAFTGVSLTGSYAAPGSTQTYANTTDFAIADNATVDSPVTVAGRSGNAPANASVTVAIVHPYIGDLKVDLVAPDGSLYNIHNRTGGSADNINRTLTLNLSSEALNGTWSLRVNDNANGDTGRIDSWSITF